MLPKDFGIKAARVTHPWLRGCIGMKDVAHNDSRSLNFGEKPYCMPMCCAKNRVAHSDVTGTGWWHSSLRSSYQAGVSLPGRLLHTTSHLTSQGTPYGGQENRHPFPLKTLLFVINDYHEQISHKTVCPTILSPPDIMGKFIAVRYISMEVGCNLRRCHTL